MSFRQAGIGFALGCGFALLLGCGSSKSTTHGAAGASSSSGGTTGSGAGSGSGAGTGTTTGGSGTVTGSAGSSNPGPGGNCVVSSMLQSLGKSKLLVGGAVEDATAKTTPFDVRYIYLSGVFPDSSEPCTSCSSGCSTGGTTCANSGPGCAWWGCWQSDQDPPGAYLRGFISTAKADQQIPMVSLYLILQASKVTEGTAEVTAANDATFMPHYYSQFRFLLQQIKSDVALIHVEPDFWGYAEQVNEDPTQIPAAVASANPTDCKTLPNTLAGMGACLVAMARSYAPNAKIGLHASGWGTKMDALHNTDPSFDAGAEGMKTGKFMSAVAPNADFIVIDAADRDAGYYESQGQQTWWDNTNKTLPDFTQAFAWAKGVSTAANKAVFWWQVPVGNMTLPNTDGQWKDNRLDYFFDHMNEVAAGQAFGVAFGAGAGGQTTFESDGGHGISRVKAYEAGAGQAPCP